MLYEIHMLKNYPPVNLNRDDSGSPKTCMFGGTMRGRISSQCLKRTWRTSEFFRTEIGEEKLGIRTRRFPTLVGDKLKQMGIDQEYIEAIKPHLTGFGTKDGKETKDGISTAQTIFYSPQDIDEAAIAVKAALDSCKSIKDVKKLKAKDLEKMMKDANIRPITLDIALFGRMVTSNAFRDVEASMQVAHAISTNKVTVESDYFTAMDDLLNGENLEEKGSAMIGDTDYNSSCYYMYASLDCDALKENLKDVKDADVLIKKAIPTLLRTMIFTNPSGKQNSFAGHILPSVVMVECKDVKIPISMVNAFVEPLETRDPLKESIRKLAEETDMVSRNYNIPIKERLWFSVDKYDISPECATKVVSNLEELMVDVSSTLE